MKRTTSKTVIPVEAERLITCLDGLIKAAKQVLEADAALQEAERRRMAKRRAIAKQSSRNSADTTR